MKKGKVISMPTTPEAQICLRARNLPIDRCYVNENWEETQMANVVVTRKHVNGNITFGFYLVDLLLLGVKDCFYGFNESPIELEEKINDEYANYMECDYELVHNIIYEGISFAEDSGFSPVKDFTKTGIYILNEDSDDIPTIDIPLGYQGEGIPVVFVTPENDRKREIAILEKAVGRGNFRVFNIDDDDYNDDFNDDDDFDDDDDDDFDDDDDDDEAYSEYSDIIDEIFDLGFENYIEEYRDKMTLMQELALTDVSYSLYFGKLDFKKVMKQMALIIEDRRFDPDLERFPGMEVHLESLKSVIEKMDDDKDGALAEMEALSAAHPDDVALGVAHIGILYDLNKYSEAEKIICNWYERTGENYAIRLLYAEWLALQDRYDEVFKLFGNKPGLDALTKDDVPFTDNMVAEFCACYTLAWLSKNEMNKAESYYQIVLMMDRRTEIANKALWEMMNKKRDAVLKASQTQPK